MKVSFNLKIDQISQISNILKSTNIKTNDSSSFHKSITVILHNRLCLISSNIYTHH